jgi:uncharacterized membrane-anchored protein
MTNALGLTNEEIVLLYLKNETLLLKFQDIIDSKKIEVDMMFDQEHGISIVKTLSDEQIEKIKSNPQYQLIVSIDSKLGNIYDLIEESDPVLVEDVKDKLELSVIDFS